MRPVLAGLLAGFSVAVAAQDAVIVHATRFPEDAARLPASVTVLTASGLPSTASSTS